ncbi:hypothetical protein AYI68_g2045 [Smittium mucronatum]|uniref:Uncharacterized protein n=1 Tax=Smittium mucronatum TaxID=133383 RepID=A0A1R0H3U4_9FUNG|nr:hypothetical protein AYI68_g2045 [Smittium mucronatum]
MVFQPITHPSPSKRYEENFFSRDDCIFSKKNVHLLIWAPLPIRTYETSLMGTSLLPLLRLLWVPPSGGKQMERWNKDVDFY